MKRLTAALIFLALWLAPSTAQFAGGIPNIAGSVLSVKATVDFNSANTDTQVNIVLPPGFTRWMPALAAAGGTMAISGASASITTATIGLFTAAGGTGTAIVTGGTTITVSSASESTTNNRQSINAAANPQLTSFTNTSVFIRIGTAQGSAAIGTVTLFYIPLS